MVWSIPIGRVSGTEIRIHITFLLFLLWIGIANYTRGGTSAAFQGLAFIILLFLCVLLHEFGHIFTARHFGVRTPDVTLLPIGGLARLERIPEEPTQELLIALAGPAVNLVIGLGLLLALGGFVRSAGYEVDDPNIGMFSRLTWVNFFLAAFNLIPAFPMDGGRVLRAALAYRMTYARATQIAATVGQGIAFLFGILGLFGGNPILLFIALFVFLGAGAESHATQIRQASRSLIVSDAMVTAFESLSPQSRLQDAVEELIRTTQHEFPVVDGAGKLRGVLTRDAMIRALREHGPDVPVINVMEEVPVIGNRQSLDQALQLLQERRLPAIGVNDSAGRLVGLVTAENVGEMMMVQAAYPRFAPGGAAAAQHQ